MHRLGEGNFDREQDEVERGGSGGGGGLAGKVKYRKCRRSRGISVRSLSTLEDGMGALGGVATSAAWAGAGRHRWCSIDARIRSTRLGSAVGVECFDHGPTLAYWGGVGQSAVKGVAIGCQGCLSRQGRLTSNGFISPVSPLLLPTPAGSRHLSGSWGIHIGECCDPNGEIPAFAGMTGVEGMAE